MTVHLDLKYIKDNENLTKAKLHFMPCTINKNGEAKVSTYFEPIISKDKNNENVFKASFRGHPLLGREINVPENYCGVVVEDTSKTGMTSNEKSIYGTHTFEKFTYWNWDVVPSNDDKIALAMDWLDVAEALHSPVDN